MKYKELRYELEKEIQKLHLMVDGICIAYLEHSNIDYKPIFNSEFKIIETIMLKDPQ